MAIVLDGTGSITGLTSGAGIAAAALSGQVPDANAPSGSVIQVLQTVKTDAFSHSSASGSFADVTGLSVNITPSSASSKILVFYTLVGCSDDFAGMHSKIQRNGTDIYLGNAASGETRASAPGFYRLGGTNESSVNCAMFLDSPNTTSALTYKIVVSGGGGTVFINRAKSTGNDFNARTPSAITLMEIAA
jgi:hypothetical protein